MELYDLLGLDKSCSKEEIKRAYKTAAIKYHPDKLKADASEEDKTKFVKIQNAYEILMDDEKRQRYDMYGVADEQAPPAHNMADMNDIFSMLFKMQGMPHMNKRENRVEPVVIEVLLELKEIVTGAEKNIAFERNVLVDIETNKTTSPNGIIYPCEACRGSGSVMMTTQHGHLITQSMQPCRKCLPISGAGLGARGSGYVNSQPTKYKFIKKKCRFDYKFKKGIKNGETITLQGLGHIDPLRANDNGDIILIIKYNPADTRFKIDGAGNLIYLQKISVFESITGSEFIINHPDGRCLMVKIPPVMPNFKRIVKKFGIPQLVNTGNDYTLTDLIIIFEVIYPIISEEQKNNIRNNFDEYYHHITAAENDSAILLDFEA